MSRRSHSPETRQKIARGNRGKIFTPDRCKAISDAKTLVPNDSQLTQLQCLWTMRHLNPKVIMELTGIRTASVYKRYCDVYCNIPQTKFIPSDMYPGELVKLIDLVSRGRHYRDIASLLNRSEKQVISTIKRMGFVPVTCGFRSHEWSSKLERDVERALIAAGIYVTSQFYIEPFYYDFHIEGTCLLIEVNGDYWHCNPRVYTSGPINIWQRYAIRRDFAKRGKAYKSGYRQLTI